MAGYEVKAIFRAETSGFESALKRMLGGLDQVLKKGDMVSKSLSSAFKKAGDGLMKVGAGVTVGVTAPIVGLATSSVKAASEFSGQMNRVQAISGATGKELEGLEKQAKDLGASTVFTAKEVAESQENLASAGFTANEIMAATPSLMNLAAAAGGNMGMASDAAATAVRQFGMEVSETGHVADVYARAASDTNAQVDTLAESMKYAGPVANAMGVSFEETAAAIGIMSNAGILGSQAGTTLRGAMVRLAKPTKQSYMAMQQLGFTAFDAQGNMKPLGQIVKELSEKTKGLSREQKSAAFSAIFGQEALSGMLALVEAGPEQFNKLNESLKNSDGSAQEMADTINQGLSGALIELDSAVDGAKIALGQALAPIIEQVARKITELLTAFNKLSPEQQQQIVKWFAIAAAVGPALVALGLVSKVISPLIGIVGKLGGGLSVLAKKFLPVANSAKTAGAAAGGTMGQFIGMGVALVGAGAGLFFAAKGFEVLAGAAVSLTEAGWPAVGVLFGMVLSIGLLMKLTATLGQQLTAGAVGIVAFGGALALAGLAMNLFAEAAAKVTSAGGPAIAVLFGMFAAVGLLAGAFALLGPALTAGAVGMVAFGATLAIAGAAMNLFAEAALKVTSGGGAAIAVFFGMFAAVGLLAGAFALLGPALTAGSMGMLAFGTMLLMATKAADVAAGAVAKVSSQLPTLAEYGSAGAKAIAELGGALIIFGAGGGVAGALTLVLAAGITALAGAVTLLQGPLQITKTALTSLAGIFPTLGSGAMQSAAGFLQLAAGVVAFTAGGVAAAGAAVAITGATVAMGGALTVAAGGSTLLAGSMAILAASLKGVQGSLTAIKQKADSAKLSLDAMKTGISTVKEGLSGFKDAIGAAFTSVLEKFTGVEEKIKSFSEQTKITFTELSQAVKMKAQEIGNGLDQGLLPGFQKAQQDTTRFGSQLTQILGKNTGPAKQAGTKTGQSFAGGLTPQLQQAKNKAKAVVNQLPGVLSSVAGKARQSGANIGNSFASGMQSALGRARSIAQQLAATADAAIRAKAKIGSPSRVQMKNGKDWVMGFVGGIKDKMGEVRKVAGGVGSVNPNMPSGRSGGATPVTLQGPFPAFAGAAGPTEIVFTMGERTYRTQVKDFGRKERQLVQLTEKYT